MILSNITLCVEFELKKSKQIFFESVGGRKNSKGGTEESYSISASTNNEKTKDSYRHNEILLKSNLLFPAIVVL